jgi:RNA polymerase sigma factor (sigma-70 family)
MDPMGEIVSQLSDTATILAKKLQEAKEERIAIETMIELLDGREQHLLRLRYFVGLTFEEVAVNMDISWRWTHEIHGRALKKLQENSNRSC